jgi:UDP-glucose 4-epimerase
MAHKLGKDLNLIVKPQNMHHNSAMASQKTLITGAAGYVGTYLAEKLVNAGEQVVLVDVKKTSAIRNLEQLGAEFIHSDLNHFDTVSLEKYKFQKIFHLAAIKRHNEEVESEKLFFSNIVTTSNVAQLALKLESRLIFTSTLYTYGNYESKSNVTERTEPLTKYGVSKLMAEEYLKMLMRTENLNCGIARLYFVVGDKDPQGVYANVIHRFKENVISGKPMEVFGSGNARLNYVWISDVLDCLEKFGNIHNRTTINIANAIDISVLEIAEEVKRSIGGEIIHVESDWTENTIRSGISAETREILGWEASFSPIEIINQVLRSKE